MSGYDHDEDLAYGEDNRTRGYEGQETDRGIVGDTFRKLKSKYQQSSYGQPPPGSSAQQYYGQSGSSGPPNAPVQQPYNAAQQQYNQPYGQPNYGQGQGQSYGQSKPDVVSKIFSGLQSTVQSIGSDVAGLLGTTYQPQQGFYGTQGGPAQGTDQQRFNSFASEKPGNDVKWYVDGCGYMWAVSRALETARESIWILDWWLSPELYLRRPPSLNEEWRLDRTLLRAAQRGVKINIIVYKEVTQALTRKYITPIVPQYLHGLLPRSTDAVTSAVVQLGLFSATAAMEYAESEYPLIAPPVTVCSSHTKHALEALHPNIAVFRHPDHLPDVSAAQSSLLSSFQGLKLDAIGKNKLGDDELRGIYGISDNEVLFWAHHEKLLIIDSNFLFMGGLDLCFGRWDLNQHPISDVHPEDLNMIIFPGQDYNNARIMDFSNVEQPFQNKLDRTKSSRMGWSDISISLQGPCVNDLCRHFIDRWNFIFNEKYNRADPRYSPLFMYGHPYGGSQNTQQPNRPPSQNSLQPPAPTYVGGVPQFPPPPGSQPVSQPAWQSTSRPHTPDPAYGQPQQAPLPATQNSYQPYRPPSSHNVSQQEPYHPQSQPQSQHPGSQGPVQQDYYPPPPPGPPPMSSPSPQPYNVSPIDPSHGQGFQSYQPPSNIAELPSQNYRQVSSTEGYDSQPSVEGTRGFYDQENPNYSGDRSLGSKIDRYRYEGRQLGSELSSVGNMIGGHVQNRVQNVHGKFLGGTDQHGRLSAQCQVVRSCTKWSNGTPTERSIQEAYIQNILSAEHFIYIENQFFITATGNEQSPVKNLVGKALVERILRAAREGRPFKVIVLLPAVPAFAGDLRDDSSLGTRAIMEYQYNSINRGPQSIMQKIASAGYNPLDYIRFYNLRNYDRINAGGLMNRVQQQGGVRYEDARKQHDDYVGAGFGGRGEGTGASQTNPGSQYQQYQAAAQKVSSPASNRNLRNSVSSSYMLNGQDIQTMPWSGDEGSEMDAFVSEELYIHSKVMIIDDRTVICGSANLNDRSMLGYHDSEIALVISDPHSVSSYMGGQPWQASRFASSLRRQLFRKHLGLVYPQDPQKPDANFEPVGVPNAYDWGSPEDAVVTDPLSPTFQALWNTRARNNTEIFRKVFHVVPDDNITSWTEYKEFYEYYFHGADASADGQGGKLPPKYQWGHVVAEDFPGGVRQVKELLSQIKGTLVEMPLCFLQGEDIAQEGLKLNPLTEEIYT